MNTKLPLSIYEEVAKLKIRENTRDIEIVKSLTKRIDELGIGERLVELVGDEIGIAKYEEEYLIITKPSIKIRLLWREALKKGQRKKYRKTPYSRIKTNLNYLFMGNHLCLSTRETLIKRVIELGKGYKKTSLRDKIAPSEDACLYGYVAKGNSWVDFESLEFEVFKKEENSLVLKFNMKKPVGIIPAGLGKEGVEKPLFLPSSTVSFINFPNFDFSSSFEYMDRENPEKIRNITRESGVNLSGFFTNIEKGLLLYTEGFDSEDIPALGGIITVKDPDRMDKKIKELSYWFFKRSRCTKNLSGYGKGINYIMNPEGMPVLAYTFFKNDLIVSTSLPLLKSTVNTYSGKEEKMKFEGNFVPNFYLDFDNLLALTRKYFNYAVIDSSRIKEIVGTVNRTEGIEGEILINF